MTLSEVRDDITALVMTALRIAEIHGSKALKGLGEETWALEIRTAVGDPDFAPSMRTHHTLETMRLRLEGESIYQCGGCRLRGNMSTFLDLDDPKKKYACYQCGHDTMIGPLLSVDAEKL